MEQSNIPSNAKETHNSKYGENQNTKLIEREEVDGTPFHITGNTEMGYSVTFGKYRLSEVKQTKEDALQELIDQHWNITARLSGVITEITIINDKEPKTINDTFNK